MSLKVHNEVSPIIDQHRERPDLLSQLKSAADAGDEQAFMSVQAQMDWRTQSAPGLLEAVQLALAVGAYALARHLATLGAELHTGNQELQNYARVLAPPTTTTTSGAPNPNLAPNRDWLMRRGDAYRGRWVALKAGHLVGSASSLPQLMNAVGDTSGMLLTKVA